MVIIVTSNSGRSSTIIWSSRISSSDSSSSDSSCRVPIVVEVVEGV